MHATGAAHRQIACRRHERGGHGAVRGRHADVGLGGADRCLLGRSRIHAQLRADSDRRRAAVCAAARYREGDHGNRGPRRRAVAAVDRLRGAGVAGGELEVPAGWDRLFCAARASNDFEGAGSHGRATASSASASELVSRHWCGVASPRREAEYQDARLRRADERSAPPGLPGCPVILTPAATGVPLATLESTGDPAHNAPRTALGSAGDLGAARGARCLWVAASRPRGDGTVRRSPWRRRALSTTVTSDHALVRRDLQSGRSQKQAHAEVVSANAAIPALKRRRISSYSVQCPNTEKANRINLTEI